MSLIEIIKNDIFAERFGGSLYTRFNQGQLECKWLVHWVLITDS